MLKTTHRPNTSSLPPGWTQHRAPSGHLYYYNTETKQSTYTRPVAETQSEELVIDYGATQPDREVQASMNAMQEFHKHSDPLQPRPGQFTGGRSYQERNRSRDDSRPNRQGDRPKSKTLIPNCAPWLLVKTKYGRRFVHNTDTKESFWKFPSDVMMAVIDLDRIEWEKKQQDGKKKPDPSSDEKPIPKLDPAPRSASSPIAPEEYDSDEYEEVEVTDDEIEDPTGEHTAKRARFDEQSDHQALSEPPAGPQEFNEDDIAWQLAQMEADEEDVGYDYDDDDQDFDNEDGAGMPLTGEDKEALFRTLLDHFQISPFSTFDALIDTNTPTAMTLIADDRWTALPNMSSRRTAFDAWSRDRVAERNATDQADTTISGNGAKQSSVATVKSKKVDPRISYLRFLSQEATPKLYWPEFKRKFRKVPEMTDRYFPDKDREKLYREYITKLKVNDADRKKEFIALLKSVPIEEWVAEGEENLPDKVEKDIKFYGVRNEKARADLVEGFLATANR